MALFEAVIEVISETLLASPRILLAMAMSAAGFLWLTQSWGGTLVGAVIGIIGGIGWEVVIEMAGTSPSTTEAPETLASRRFPV